MFHNVHCYGHYFIQINWVNIGNKIAGDENEKPKRDPCLAVIGTDLFVIGGLNSANNKIDNTWGYRLSESGTWFKVMDYLLTKRAGAACVVDKRTKDIFTIGGNSGNE